MKEIKIYTTNYCPYCQRAKAFFASKKWPYQEIDLTDNQSLREELQKKTGWMTVPMIFIGDEFIGGCDDLMALDKEGKLLTLVNG